MTFLVQKLWGEKKSFQNPFLAFLRQKKASKAWPLGKKVFTASFTIWYRCHGGIDGIQYVDGPENLYKRFRIIIFTRTDPLFSCWTYLNPNHIGVKYLLDNILKEGETLMHASVLPLFIYLFLFFWNKRYLSWLRQYQKDIFILSKQCYYGVNTGSFHWLLRRMAQFAPPSPWVTCRE